MCKPHLDLLITISSGGPHTTGPYLPWSVENGQSNRIPTTPFALPTNLMLKGFDPLLVDIPALAKLSFFYDLGYGDPTVNQGSTCHVACKDNEMGWSF